MLGDPVWKEIRVSRESLVRTAKLVLPGRQGNRWVVVAKLTPSSCEMDTWVHPRNFFFEFLDNSTQKAFHSDITVLYVIKFAFSLWGSLLEASTARWKIWSKDLYNSSHWSYWYQSQDYLTTIFGIKKAYCILKQSAWSFRLIKSFWLKSTSNFVRSKYT